MNNTSIDTSLFGGVSLDKLKLFRAHTYPSFFNQFCAVIKNMGIKRIIVEEKVDTDTFLEPTLLLLPRGIFGTPFVDQQLRSVLLSAFYDSKGVHDFARHILSYPIPEGATPITISSRNKENHATAGFILPDKNCIVLFYSPFATSQRIRFMKDTLNPLLQIIGGVEFKIDPNILKKKQESALNLQIQKFGEFIDRQRRSLEGEIHDMSARIEMASRDMIELERHISLKKTTIETLANTKTNFSTEFKGKVEAIKELNFVKSVELDMVGIKIYVGKISIQKTYIGDFTIYITPQDVKFRNPHRKEIYEHPHIREGLGCFGDARPVVNKLLSEFRLKELVFLLYQFLNTYSLKGVPYVRMPAWTEFREKENIFDSQGNYKQQINKPIPTQQVTTK